MVLVCTRVEEDNWGWLAGCSCSEGLLRPQGLLGWQRVLVHAHPCKLWESQKPANATHAHILTRTHTHA